jgi:hypothetical protein
MQTLKTRRKSVAQNPKVSEEDQEQLLNETLALKKSTISRFLAESGLMKSGTKDVICHRIDHALREGQLSNSDLVQLLDDETPWGKQHVYLFKGPTKSIDQWKDLDWVAKHLKRFGLSRCLNAKVPLALPPKMTLSSIAHDGRRIRITAVKRRDWLERNPDYDRTDETEDGDPVELRAFIQRVSRGLITFDWDLPSNTAFLQIAQHPTGVRYELVAQEFFNLIRKWLSVDDFNLIDLRPVIKKLHELEENGGNETRSHGINYRTLEGRSIEGKSASPAEPLLGEPAIDVALGAIRKAGVGNLGNFYWLPNHPTRPSLCPLTSEVHVIIVGYHNRINFPVSNGEDTVRYVLSRIRCHCP